VSAGIIELSTGHVFAAGSVVAIDPLVQSPIQGCRWSFHMHGVGFDVRIDIAADLFRWRTFALPDGDPYFAHIKCPRERLYATVALARAEAEWNNRIDADLLRQEFVDKLLGGAP
jgi:hypothetical protein